MSDLEKKNLFARKANCELQKDVRTSFIKVQPSPVVSLKVLRDPKGEPFHVFRKFRNGVHDAGRKNVNKQKFKNLRSNFFSCFSRALRFELRNFEYLTRPDTSHNVLGHKAQFSQTFLICPAPCLVSSSPISLSLISSFSLFAVSHIDDRALTLSVELNPYDTNLKKAVELCTLEASPSAAHCGAGRSDSASTNILACYKTSNLTKKIIGSLSRVNSVTPRDSRSIPVGHCSL